MNKTALITGATDGIGKAIALKLLTEGWKIVIISRNQKKCDRTVVELQNISGKKDISAITADLSSMHDTAKACEQFLSTHQSLDLLLLNANAISNQRIITPDGYEQNFALGYLSRVLMIHKLEALMKSTKDSQILSVLGMSYKRLDFEDVHQEKKFKGFDALTRWQWAIIVHALKHNQKAGVPLNIYMPGLVKTKILANEPQPMRMMVKIANVFMGISTEKSAENLYFCINEIFKNKQKQVLYSYRKLKPFPKIELHDGDMQKLEELTNKLLLPFA